MADATTDAMTDIDTKMSFLLMSDFLKSKDITEANTKLYEIIDIDGENNNKNAIYNDILREHFTILPTPVETRTMMSESTFTDMQLDLWCDKQGHTMGGRDLFHQMVSSPTTDIELLKKRQKSIRHIKTEWQNDVKKLAELEKEMLWIYTLPKTFEDVWPIPLLFPSFPILNKVNQSPTGLSVYHTYRIWIMPFLQLVIPVLSIITPWLYLKYRMKWKLSLMDYFRLIKFLFVQSMTGIDWKQKANRYGSILIYGIMFVYGIIQSIDISRMLYKVKDKLLKRIENIYTFVEDSYKVVSQWERDAGLEPITKPMIPAGMAGVYAIWIDEKLRNDITKYIQRFYELDVSISCKLLIEKEKWSFATYVKGGMSGGGMTICQALRNPLLDRKQISNPMCLSKNIIITGPNAAGKSTYVRSIGANIICAQTLGICSAKVAKINPVQAILSYMRIRDLIGDKSLFETEVSHCSRILQTAVDIQNAGKTAVIFFDEPMHSTPALEGEAAAYAVLEYLGTLKNIRTIVTSHYHRLTALASGGEEKGEQSEKGKTKNRASNWVNLCMDAVHDAKTDTYSFPYRIRSGASFQSIALELLRGKEQLPETVVQNAIKFKSSINKLETNES